MKLRDKTLLIIGLTFIPLLAITYVDKIRFSYFTLAATIILFSLLIFFLLYTFILKTITRLNHEIGIISSKKNLAYRLPSLDTHDEISSISRHANKILDLSQASRRILEQHLEEQSQQIQMTNMQNQPSESETITTQTSVDNWEYLAQISRYDDLTALPNRVFFNEILNKAISHTKRRKKNLAILAIDIDGFKNIYTQLGREKSNEVLKEIGKRFSNALRSEDVIAKLDGDEFIVLLSDIGKPKFASTVAEKILKSCSTPILLEKNKPISFTASIGICIYPNDGESLETLLQHADDALHKAKHTGKNKYQFFTQEMDIEGHEYIQIENALRQAIQNNEFSVYYQPKMHIKKGIISGVEALIRWENPQLGIISPSKFITIAEESGLIMQIGEWALRETCKTNKYWQDEGYEHLSASINLSPKQFHHPEIVNVISKALNETGLNPKYLEIEITEKTIMDDAEAAAKILNDIKSTGVQISIDHFGTGYTSISYLKQFPINVLKIDQSFTKGIPNTPNDLAIISAIIALAHNLGLEVIAEGVETAEQVQYLATQNCDMVQGYFLSHPLPAQKIVLQFKKLRDNVMI